MKQSILIEQFKTKLEAIGFKTYPNNLQKEGNLCTWVAYRRSKLTARECETNDDKCQISVEPFFMTINGVDYSSAEVALRGEYNGIWWNLNAYSLEPDEFLSKVDTIEASLVKAWNALSPN